MKKTILITGAASGIGTAFAHIFAGQGDDLVIVGRNEEKMAAMKAEFEEKYGISAFPVRADLSKDGAAQGIFDRVQESGLTVDVLINNAGVGDYGRLADASWDRLRDIVGLNMISLMHLMKLYAADMEKRGGGKILNVASIAAYMPGPYMPLYFASKSFVYSISQAVHKEMEGTGVTVTCLCPGPTATNFEKASGMGPQNKMFTFFKPMTAEYVARVGYKAMMKGKAVVTTKFYFRCLKLACRLGPEKLKRDLTKKINYGS